MTEHAIISDPSGEQGRDYILQGSCWLQHGDLVLYITTNPEGIHVEVHADGMEDWNPIRDLDADFADAREARNAYDRELRQARREREEETSHMDKLAFIAAQDVESIQEIIEQAIQKVLDLQNEASRLRYEQRDLIANGNGKAEALTLEEARLTAQVTEEFAGVKSNAEQRDARLSRLKSSDPQYRSVADQAARLKQQLELIQADIEFHGAKARAAEQSLRYKAMVLRFLSPGD